MFFDNEIEKIRNDIKESNEEIKRLEKEIENIELTNKKSTLIHEFGHFIILKHFNNEIVEIKINIFDGHCTSKIIVISDIDKNNILYNNILIQKSISNISGLFLEYLINKNFDIESAKSDIIKLVINYDLFNESNYYLKEFLLNNFQQFEIKEFHKKFEFVDNKELNYIIEFKKIFFEKYKELKNYKNFENYLEFILKYSLMIFYIYSNKLNIALKYYYKKSIEERKKEYIIDNFELINKIFYKSVHGNNFCKIV